MELKPWIVDAYNANPPPAKPSHGNLGFEAEVNNVAVGRSGQLGHKQHKAKLESFFQSQPTTFCHAKK